MRFFEICSMPTFVTSHTFEADSFHNKTSIWQNKIEITYLAEGNTTSRRGNEINHLEKGDISVSFKDIEGYTDSDSYHKHHTMMFDLEWKYADNETSSLYLPGVTKSCPETKEIEKIIDDVIFSPHKYINSPTRSAAAVFAILHKIDSINRKNTGLTQPEYSLKAEKAKIYIQNNLTKPITQKSIADHLGISPSHLCNIFKKAEGVSLMRYINTLKLNDIRAMVKTRDIKLYEAAEYYGYNDANYVSSLHKKIFGYNITD